MLRITTKPSHKETLKSWMRPPPYVTNAELKARNTAAKLFADWPGPAVGSGRLQPHEETLLFKQFHFSAFQLSRLYRAADRSEATGRKREYSMWVERYHRIRTRLIEANLGLVYDLIGRSRFENLDRDEMTSEGMMALLRAVDTFDPWRGFRFSTYACNAILRAFARAAMQDFRRRGRVLGTYDEDFEKGDMPQQVRQDQRALFAERLQRILRLDNADLTDVEKTVLARRFPLADDRPRQTLEEIGRMMRVSKERVRQIQLSAIAKLRRAMAADVVLQ
jgi:RNA polymerase primary sigma factor